MVWIIHCDVKFMKTFRRDIWKELRNKNIKRNIHENFNRRIAKMKNQAYIKMFQIREKNKILLNSILLNHKLIFLLNYFCRLAKVRETINLNLIFSQKVLKLLIEKMLTSIHIKVLRNWNMTKEICKTENDVLNIWIFRKINPDISREIVDNMKNELDVSFSSSQRFNEIHFK